MRSRGVGLNVAASVGLDAGGGEVELAVSASAGRDDRDRCVDSALGAVVWQVGRPPLLDSVQAVDSPGVLEHLDPDLASASLTVAATSSSSVIRDRGAAWTA